MRRVCPRCWSIYTSEKSFCGIDGEKLVESDEDPLIGRTLDRYRVIERLGTGAMGAVYKAEHIVLDRLCALKVLFGDFASDARLVARFRREAHTASSIKHKNIVEVVDFGTADSGLSFLVMELVEGENLSEVLKRDGQIEPTRAGRITRDIALALGEAHRLGFVHRDLKPANVMLANTEDGEVAKILDFGVVGAVGPDDNTKLTRTGTIVGTPLYMAPEQAQGDPASPSSDIYSLGVILFEMLCGKPPFTGDSLRRVVMKHLTEAPPPVPPSLGLERLVPALMQKQPSKRPNKADAVVAEIDRILEAAREGKPLSSELLDAVIDDGLEQLPPVSGAAASHPTIGEIRLDTDPPPPAAATVERGSQRVFKDTGGDALTADEIPTERPAPTPTPQIIERVPSPPPRSATPAPRWAPPPAASPVSTFASAHTHPSVADLDDGSEFLDRRRSSKGPKITMVLLLVGAVAVTYVWSSRPSATNIEETLQAEDGASARSTRKRKKPRMVQKPMVRDIKGVKDQAQLETKLERMLALRGISEDELESVSSTSQLFEAWKASAPGSQEAQQALSQLIERVRDPKVEVALLKRKLATVQQRIEISSKLPAKSKTELRRRGEAIERALDHSGILTKEGRRRSVAEDLGRLASDLRKARIKAGDTATGPRILSVD